MPGRWDHTRIPKWESHTGAGEDRHARPQRTKPGVTEQWKAAPISLVPPVPLPIHLARFLQRSTTMCAVLRGNGSLCGLTLQPDETPGKDVPPKAVLKGNGAFPLARKRPGPGPAEHAVLLCAHRAPVPPCLGTAHGTPAGPEPIKQHKRNMQMIPRLHAPSRQTLRLRKC